jgi:hypothetical protein
MKILVVKTLNNLLKPAYDSDLEAFAKIPKGEVVQIEYVKKRNIRFHRKFFALMKLAFDNQNVYQSADEMRYDITITAGFTDEITNKITGEVTLRAKSISFDSMDETEFSDLYAKTKDVICNWIGITSEDLEEEIEQYF